jgi:hypothetical protein
MLLLFYRQPKYHKSSSFNFSVEVVYEDLGQKELSELVNRKAIEDNAVLRTVLTVYERAKNKNISNIQQFELRANGQIGVFCHLLVFEKRKD